MGQPTKIEVLRPGDPVFVNTGKGRSGGKTVGVPATILSIPDADHVTVMLQGHRRPETFKRSIIKLWKARAATSRINYKEQEK